MNKEFYEDARKVAESCSKERLVELYLAEVQTCCELEEHKDIVDNTIEMYAEKCKRLEEQLNSAQVGEQFALKCCKEAVELLENAIVPKFKIGQEVFVIIQGVVRTTSINSFRVFEGYEVSYYCKYVDGERMYLELDESELFATEEEARAKLKEIQGE